MNLERLPSIVAFKSKEELPTRPRTLGSVLGRLQREQMAVATYKVKASSEKRPLMENLDNKLLWQIAILEDIRNQEQLDIMLRAGEHISIPTDLYGVVRIPVFDERAHNMSVSRVAAILRTRVEFAAMTLDFRYERRGNHFAARESFAYAQDLYDKLTEAA